MRRIVLACLMVLALLTFVGGALAQGDPVTINNVDVYVVVLSDGRLDVRYTLTFTENEAGRDRITEMGPFTQPHTIVSASGSGPDGAFTVNLTRGPEFYQLNFERPTRRGEQYEVQVRYEIDRSVFDDTQIEGQPYRVIGWAPFEWSLPIERQEIRYILPLLLSALALAEKRIPTILPLVSCGPQADRAALEAIVNRLSPRAIVTEDTIALLSASKAALTKSGTITLDAAVCGVPMVVTYAGSALDHLQYHLFAKGRLKYIAAPNILLDREVVPERIAGMGTPEHLCEALLPLIEEGEPRRAQQAGLAEAVELLGPPGASERVARMILDLAG